MVITDEAGDVSGVDVGERAYAFVVAGEKGGGHVDAVGELEEAPVEFERQLRKQVGVVGVGLREKGVTILAEDVLNIGSEFESLGARTGDVEEEEQGAMSADGDGVEDVAAGAMASPDRGQLRAFELGADYGFRHARGGRFGGAAK